MLAGGPLLLIALAFAAAMTAGLIQAAPRGASSPAANRSPAAISAHRIPIAGSDEFGTLAELFSNIAVRLRAEQTMNQRASARIARRQ